MTIRLLGRCISITRIPGSLYSRTFGCGRGGQETPWPWFGVKIGPFDINISRTRPRKGGF